MRFELEITGLDGGKRRVTGMGERATNLRPAGDRIIRELAQGERRRFATSVGWPPLAASTKRRKRRQGLPLRAMHASGRLSRVLSAPGRQRERLEKVSRTQVRFGIKGGRSDIFYGRFHQKGRGVPKRKVIVFTDETKRAVRTVVADHVIGHGR